MEEILVGLDIGTTKTCAVIGTMNANSMVEVIGVGVTPSKGLKNGVIVNIDNTMASVVKAIDEARADGRVRGDRLSSSGSAASTSRGRTRAASSRYRAGTGR